MRAQQFFLHFNSEDVFAVAVVVVVTVVVTFAAVVAVVTVVVVTTDEDREKDLQLIKTDFCSRLNLIKAFEWGCAFERPSIKPNSDSDLDPFICSSHLLGLHLA